MLNLRDLIFSQSQSQKSKSQSQPQPQTQTQSEAESQTQSRSQSQPQSLSQSLWLSQLQPQSQSQTQTQLDAHSHDSSSANLGPTVDNEISSEPFYNDEEYIVESHFETEPPKKVSRKMRRGARYSEEAPLEKTNPAMLSYIYAASPELAYLKRNKMHEETIGSQEVSNNHDIISGCHSTTCITSDVMSVGISIAQQHSYYYCTLSVYLISICVIEIFDFVSYSKLRISFS